MNAPLPEVLLGVRPGTQASLPLASCGVQRYVWESAFGPILIEAEASGGDVWVNGQRVVQIAEMQEVDGTTKSHIMR